MANEFDHRPVLLAECIEHLHLEPGATVVDGTLGGGGHAAAILERTSPGGVLIGLDLDSAALDAAANRLAAYGERLHRVNASFRSLHEVLDELGIAQVDAVLLDLGVSSHQLDTPARGFRFSGAEDEDVPLDMRMHAGTGITAADLLRRSSARELQTFFQDYGELPGSKRLAAAIVEARKEAPIETSRDLLRVIRSAHIGGGRRHNPATLVYQALRIAVNDELGALREGLDTAIDALRPGGRLVVISYHSLEDRIVKNSFRDAVRGCTCPPRVPVCRCGGQVRLRVLTRRPLKPSDDEVRANPRARSARLRAAERVEASA